MIAVLEWQVKPAGTIDSNDMAVALTGTTEKQQEYYEDSEWRQLDRNVKTIRHQITNGRYTAGHPDMALLKKDLEFAEELLQERQAQLDELWRNRTNAVFGVPIVVSDPNSRGYFEESVSVEQQLARARREKEILKAELVQQRVEFDELFATAQLLEEEKVDLKHKRDLFEAVRQRKDQKDMERNVPGSIEVLSKAFVPSQPQSNRRIVFTAMALVMGLGMGGGVAFLRASRNQTVYTLKDMPYPLQVPLLGHVPVFQAKRSQKKAIPKSPYTGEEYESGHVESIRFVRTTLLTRLQHNNKAAVLITSAASGTGKSHFAMTLGESFARAGKKVLLIDADLRKRTLTQRYNLAEKPGFVESLCSRSVDKRRIFPTETVGLSIMPAGRWNEGEAFFEQTANGVFKACISQLRKDYEIILLDSSPILPVADATILSSQVDGTIMVERELVSRRGSQSEALTRLISSGGNLLGTVFVSSDNRGEYYSHDYAYSREKRTD